VVFGIKRKRKGELEEEGMCERERERRSVVELVKNEKERKKDTHEKTKKERSAVYFYRKLKGSPTLATMKKRAQNRRGNKSERQRERETSNESTIKCTTQTTIQKQEWDKHMYIPFSAYSTSTTIL
jgi:hypothetical protein